MDTAAKTSTNSSDSQSDSSGSLVRRVHTFPPEIDMFQTYKQQEIKKSKQLHDLRLSQCCSVLNLPRLGRSLKQDTSPWT
ncbi:Disease resistance protein ADR2 [Labeo rohita]|uniref:Disease resistance protein ADR2 n=1 Tax=Labeo rohita TaxID=84645 RepID=A0ABQ8MJE1_LABRO|nr:Disease resistance protein ADR2 [Labeo rohita]